MIHRRNYLLLKKAQTKPELASILGIPAAFLTRVVYKPGVSTHYHQFKIPKKSGGARSISAPSSELKDIQRRLSDLLLDCKAVIHVDNKVECTLSHGFERERSIITNARVHSNKKNILNLDLEDFFGSFNFGRVRGYFIANKHFKLHPHIATVLAQIACFENKLPQGSPCSPAIANLITSSLDIKLSTLAKRSGCSYTRYADDITFSTRKSAFPVAIIKDDENLTLGSKLLGEIRRAGFSVNPRKTRLQFKDSRQEATGLVVNKKVSVKSEYWRLTRAMAHSLFKNGKFHIPQQDGTHRDGLVSELEGRLTFIDSVDFFNNLANKKHPASKFEPRVHSGLNGFRGKLNSREVVYGRFLHYKHFFANEYPTILTEGKTDNVYLKSALSILQGTYPNLVTAKTATGPYKPKLKFPHLNRKTMYLLDIGDGATPFVRFVQRYANDLKQFEDKKAINPVILILDNDDGPNVLLNHLVNKVKSCPNDKATLKNSGFIHIFHNLYLILTPLKAGGKDSAMEDLFDKATLARKVGGKTFSTAEHFDNAKHYGKHIFSTKIVRSDKNNINFDKFNHLFEEVEKVIQHYETL
ncbi:retron Ec67 family RNA-directed DNA polymerase/endonuclease [Brumicola pallidula]|uniref:RNA-directed DNA polymerase n=1 Tax=Brumicola pallidula DSM 14239 = ACAM 615 TaxID=1121922 RepID=K6Z2A1_9ALTE|nr:retron Ec67 family RNA-directed DNA polymerase/endonuclease [Glaciecola pallidula]GAC30306.1 retron EC67 protein [Glaciecola pallidula DSM 14239 = ACAM 615]